MKQIVTFIVCAFLILGVFACGDGTSTTSTNTKPIPEENSLGAKIMKINCSSCHGVPHPSVHKAEEWPNVVERMETHRVLHAYDALTQLDKQELIMYLQKHAAL